MKKGIIFILAILLLVNVVSAIEGIQVEEVTSETIIEPGQAAEFSFTVTNVGSKTQQLNLQAEPYIGLPSSTFEYMFIEPNYLALEGHESVKLNITAQLKEGMKVGKRYKTYFTIQSLDDKGIDQTYNLQLFLKEPTDPVTMYISDMSEVVAPGSNLVITLSLNNNVEEDLSNIDLHLTSDLFEEEKTVQVFQGQERDVEFIIPVTPSTPPKDYSFSVRLYMDDELITTDSGSFTIGSNSDIEEDVSVESKFLFEKTTVSKTNKGNLIVSESHTQDVSLITGWFAGYNINPSQKVAGEANWYFNLAPEENYTITVTIDYRPLVISLIVLLMLVLVLYYLFTKRVTVTKEVFKLKYSTDGLSEFKVQLHIKNNTNKKIKDVSVIDRLPKVIQPSTQFGTLQPHRVQRGDKGIRIMWKMKELLNGEERIITYNVTTGMKVIGDLNLPRAVAKYKNESKKTIRLSSNKPKIYSGAVQRLKKKVHHKPKHKKK